MTINEMVTVEMTPEEYAHPVGITSKEVLSVRRYKAGYEIRTERWSGPACGKAGVKTKMAYTPSGDCLGEPMWAQRLIVRRGIAPELRTKTSTVCSIGFSARDGKWYGWSHRAIYGFAIGDTVKKGDCAAERLKIGFKAKTVADTKKMAIAFAESVD